MNGVVRQKYYRNYEAFFLLSALVILTSEHLSAQNEPERTFRRKYTNLSFVSQHLDLSPTYATEKLSSKYGAAVTTGRTFYVHKTPLFEIICFAIDATFFDINFAHYSTTNNLLYLADSQDFEIGEKLKFYQGEIGIQAGPSVTVNPVSRLQIQAYYRFSPTYATLYDDFAGEIYSGYASFSVIGGSISWGGIGIGAEARWGKPKYGNIGYEDYFDSAVDKYKVNSARVYLTLGF